MAEGSEGLQPQEAEFRLGDCRRKIDLRYYQPKERGDGNLRLNNTFILLRSIIESLAAIKL